MDRSYKGDLPRHRKALATLRREFAQIEPATDWVALRIEPLLAHVTALERRMTSARFARESARLRKGVAMFHADLVYLRTNIQALKKILAAEQRSRRTKKPGEASA